ncbi:hypothetical protein [Mucilaginibacter psychrotolerans]|uniref:Uncharacterized protein n=1 Tax=Mucilaginibacter psychrotolerans TaxID=1524096 RepID=A0A4Y8SMJ7_9SPHI|nr:hypothetical protein [Mucilaginibacter psychrotolerans]TFF39606.1 hypothetical protein E2R66_04340 [Mucilaginibacter psychrotolerans]
MRYLSFILFIVAIGLSACKKETVDPQYENSYSAYLSFKKSSNNSYSYVTYNGSWTGSYAESKITIQNGKLVARDFFFIRPTVVPNAPDTLAKWAESGSTLNTHTDGFEGLTLDQVYAKAKNEWLNVDKNENDIVFNTDNNGLISLAGYSRKGCLDDCLNGIYVRDIKVYVKEIK